MRVLQTTFFQSLDGQLVAVPVRFNGTATDLGGPRRLMRLIQPPSMHMYSYDIASGRADPCAESRVRGSFLHLAPRARGLAGGVASITAMMAYGR